MNRDSEYDLRAIINTELAYCNSIEEQKRLLNDIDKVISGYRNRIDSIEKSIKRKIENQTLEKGIHITS